MKRIKVRGDATDISIFDDSGERVGNGRSQATLRAPDWQQWHWALLDRSDLHPLVGGTELVKGFRLMLVPAGAWPDKVNRGPALGWPIYERGHPVNVIRRFLDNKGSRYKGLTGRGHQIWPDWYTDRPSITSNLPMILVCGMRDACFLRAAGFHGFTYTGGVMNWADSGIENRGCFWRDFIVSFDRGEQRYAEALAAKLRRHGAKSVRVLPAPREGDIAALSEARGIDALKHYIEGGK